MLEILALAFTCIVLDSRISSTAAANNGDFNLSYPGFPSPTKNWPEALSPTSQTDAQAVEYNKKISTLWNDWTSRTALKGGSNNAGSSVAVTAPSAAKAIAAARGHPPQRSQVCSTGCQKLSGLRSKPCLLMLGGGGGGVFELLCVIFELG